MTKSNGMMQRADSLGVRLTSPRREIIAAIEAIAGPFSATDLLEAVERHDPNVGRATVFRTLQLLCEADLVERVRVEEGQDMYVAGHSTDHHHHLVCTDCGDITEVSGCDVGALARAIALDHGYRATRHTFEIYGLCPECRKAKV